MTTEKTMRNAVNIMPDYDIVPRVDRRDDMTQHIECRHANDGSRHNIGQMSYYVYMVCNGLL